MERALRVRFWFFLRVEVGYFGRVDGCVVLEVGGGGYAAADVGGWLDRLGEGAEGGGGAEGAEGCHCWRRRRY